MFVVPFNNPNIILPSISYWTANGCKPGYRQTALFNEAASTALHHNDHSHKQHISKGMPKSA
jgi:hypothetical protein